MKIGGVEIDKKFIIAAMIGAIFGAIAIRILNRFFDPLLDVTAGPGD